VLKKSKKDKFVKHVKDIEAGKSSVEDCLDRYPSVRKQLEPLLRTALEIRKRRGNGFGKV
jgi:hypothetical protein